MVESVQIREPEGVDAQALERDREDRYIRWLGARGRFYEIAQPLSAVVGAVEERAIVVPQELRGGFRPSSPSVCMHGEERRAILRGVNYRQAAAGVTLFDFQDTACRTQNWWIEFDRNWQPTSFKVMADPYPERPGAVQGYEDCRLFHAAGSYWASCNFAERPALFGDGAFNLLCEMGLLQLADDGSITSVKAIRGPWSDHHQKNWKPAPCSGSPLRWIYSSDPLMLVTPEMATERRSIRWHNLSPWRGGSQALPIGNHWLWVDHRAVVNFDGMRNLYLHRFVLGNSDLSKIDAVSAPWVFRNFGIEFCAGAAIDGDRLVLSYSMRDAFPFLAICPLEGVLASLGEAA